MELKTCKKCGVDKPATTEYFYQKNGYLTSPCKNCQQQTQADYYQANKPQSSNTTTKQKDYRTRNRKRLAKQQKVIRSEHRLRALWHYGDQPPSCACCGEDNIKFLGVIDTTHRKAYNSHRAYAYLKKHSYPDGFEVMCHNCSFAICIYGECPHDPTKTY